MPDRVLQPSLIGGELSDTLYGRVDIDRYRQSLALCENFIVNPHGGVENRPGSEYVGLTKLQDGSTVRLIAFQPNAETSYILEFGHHYLRIWDDDGLVMAGGYDQLAFNSVVDDSAEGSWLGYADTVNYNYTAQGFVLAAPATFEIGMIALKLKNSFGGTPGVMDLKVAIYSDAAGVPDVALSGMGFEDFQSLNEVGMRDLPHPNDNGIYKYFKLKDPAAPLPTLTAGTKYHIVIRRDPIVAGGNLFTIVYADHSDNFGAGETRLKYRSGEVGAWTSHAFADTEIAGGIFNNDQDAIVELETPWGAVNQDDLGTESQISRLVVTQSVDVMTIVDGTKQTEARELKRFGGGSWTLDFIQRFTSVCEPFSVTFGLAPPLAVPLRQWQYAVSGVTTDGKEGLPVLSAEVGVGSNISNILPLYIVITVGDEIPDHYNVYKGLDGTFGYIGHVKVTRDTAEIVQDAYDDAYNDSYTQCVYANGGPPAGFVVDAACRLGAQLAGNAARDAAAVSGGLVSGVTEFRFADDNIAPDYTDPPRDGANPFTEEGGYKPAAVCYFQQRLVFGNVNERPDTLYMSEVSDYQSFQRNIPTVDDDSIQATIAHGQLNEIRFLVPLRDILVLTTGAEHILTGGGKPVAPSNLDTAPVSYRGSGTLHPLHIGNVILFKDIGGHIREWLYQQDSNDYPGTDVGLLASHLFKDEDTRLPVKVTEWCYVSSPLSVVAAIRADGTLLTFTYVREQSVAAWARHTTQGKYRSIVAARKAGSEGEVVYQVVQRNLAGAVAWMIEKIATRNERLSPFADCAVVTELASQLTNGQPAGEPNWTFPGSLPGDLVANAEVEIKIPKLLFEGALLIPPVWPDFNGTEKRWIVLYDADENRYTMRIIAEPSFGFETVYLVRLDQDIPAHLFEGDTFDGEDTGSRWELGAKLFTGLDHLEGETVAIRADDGVHAPLVVASGSVTLSLIVNRFTAGLPYDSTIRTLPLASQQGDVKSKLKLISSIGIDVARTKGVWVGESLDDMTQMKPDIVDPTMPDTGRIDARASNRWGKAGQFYVQNRDPQPCSILAVAPEVTIGGG